MPLFILGGCANQPSQLSKTDVDSSETKGVITAKNIKKTPQQIYFDELIQKRKERREAINAYNKTHIYFYEQDEPGSYQITKDDNWLIKNYTKLFVYREVKSGKGDNASTLHLPSYAPLKITRSGTTANAQKWKVNIDEKMDGEFTIKGINSTGNPIEQECRSLLLCLKLI